MEEKIHAGLPDRRDFLRKINLLGALTVSGNLLNPHPETLKTAQKPPAQVGKSEIAGQSWPVIRYEKDAELNREYGPNLANLFCRLDVGVSGNIRHFQIIGNHAETQFVQVLHATESFVYWQNQFYSLAASDEVQFEYALSYISVVYKSKQLPFEIIKKIYLAPHHAGCVQHVSISNKAGGSRMLYFIEKAKFTLGDPYYTMPVIRKADHYSGFEIRNELAGNYRSSFLMSGNDIERVFTRDDQIRFQMDQLKEAWTGDQLVYRNCDDQSALLQKKLNVLPDGSGGGLVIYYAAAPSSKEATDGINETDSIFRNDRLPTFEKELQQQATDYAMISTPDTLLNQGFAISNKIANQVFQTSGGLVALPGHMYANFYSRDSHWQIRGLLVAGKFETVKTLLTHLIRYQNAEGSFPTRINLEGKPLYHTGAPDLDSAAFISLSIIEYIRWSKDFAFGESNWKIISASIEYLKSRDNDQDGWIEQEYNEDWADRMKRYGKVNYTQCIWFQLLKEAAALGKLLKKKEAADYDRMAAMLRKNYDKMFWDEGSEFYIDYITPGGERMKKLSQDVCLAFIFGLAADKRKIRSHLQKLKAKCWGTWGPAHHEGYQDGDKYDPLGFYCNGGVWMWLTAFEALAHFRYGDPENGIAALNAIKEYEFGKNPYRAVYFDTTEWHDHHNGLNCEFDWKACRNFTTGSGSHVWSIAAGLFGLQIPMEGNITWDPRFPDSWRGKAIEFSHLRKGNQWNSITFTYSGSWKGESKTEEK